MKKNCIALALLSLTYMATAQNQAETLTIPLSKELGGPLSGTYYHLIQVPPERIAPEMIPDGIEHYQLLYKKGNTSSKRCHLRILLYEKEAAS